MRIPALSTLAVLALTGAALAQAPVGADPATGARPGHIPGVGESPPRSGAASNITSGDTRSTIAPTLPGAGIGDTNGPHAYLRVAREALAAGRTGQAQESLEMAETRVLDRSVAPSQAGVPSGSAMAATIRDARLALGAGDRARALMLIDQALAG